MRGKVFNEDAAAVRRLNCEKLGKVRAEGAGKFSFISVSIRVEIKIKRRRGGCDVYTPCYTNVDEEYLYIHTFVTASRTTTITHKNTYI